MTLENFAIAIDMSRTYVGNRILSGELPAQKILINKRYIYEIDESLVDEWKIKCQSLRKKRPYNPNLSHRFVKHRETKHSSLNEAIKKLNVYNKKHGTNYSYGEATAKGII